MMRCRLLTELQAHNQLCMLIFFLVHMLGKLQTFHRTTFKGRQLRGTDRGLFHSSL